MEWNDILGPTEAEFSARVGIGAVEVAALLYYASLGLSFTRMMADNRACYRSRRFAKLTHCLRLMLLCTRPYAQKTTKLYLLRGQD